MSGRAPRMLAYAARGYLVLLFIVSLLFIGDGREVRFLPWAMIASCVFLAIAWFGFGERRRAWLVGIAVLAGAAGASLGEGEGIEMNIFLLMLIAWPIVLGLPLALALHGVSHRGTEARR
ncbi:MAG TPA: hypothetical protein VF705_12830 [Longimicrobium sp.]